MRAAHDRERCGATFVNLIASASIGLVASGILLMGCGGTDGSSAGALMLPGEDCSRCHSFTVAGTVFQPSGGGAPLVEVAVGGVTLTSNTAGNFYAAAPLTFPAAVEVRKGGAAVAMVSPAPHGWCNRCHDGASQARVTLP